MNIKVIVAAHKQYPMPEDSMYFPLHVGRALADKDFGWQGDNIGDNISLKNNSYCELTGLYWAWKNLNADAIGLVHYRRYFRHDITQNLVYNKDKKYSNILTYTEAENLIYHYPVILPKKRNYFIETIESQYAHAHNKEHIRKIRETLKYNCSDYLDAFDKHMNERSGHMFNMFIMRYEYFVNYCSWIFKILFELEKIIGDTNRTLGFIGERLLDVWLIKNMIDYVELEIYYTEKQKKIKKYFDFIKRFALNR